LNKSEIYIIFQHSPQGLPHIFLIFFSMLQRLQQITLYGCVSPLINGHDINQLEPGLML